MKAGLSQSTQLKQELKINPRLYQAMDLLYMPLLDLQQHLKQELLNNPFLDMVEPEEDEEESDDEDGRDRDRKPRPNRPKRRQRQTRSTGRRSSSTASTPAAGAKSTKSASTTSRSPSTRAILSDHLIDQITLLDLTPRQQFLADEFIGNINEDGYLACPLEQISCTPSTTTVIKAAEVDGSRDRRPAAVHAWRKSSEMLVIIQNLDPPGVGARDLRECLMLQLKEAGLEQSVPFRLVRDCFEELINHRWSEISKRFGISPGDVQKAADEIKKLDPKPGLVYSAASDNYIIPDLIVEKIDGKYHVFLNDANLPRLKLSRAYQEIARDKKKFEGENKEFISSKLNSANWMIQAIEQRRQTMLKVMNYIVDRQRDFFEKGVQYLKPLTLREVAEVINMHESTVSRVTNEKFVQTPRGVLPLKFFFSSGLSTTAGEDVSARGIKAQIEKLVSEEDPKHPLTDQAIVNILKEGGVQIARRTVAKYRDQLGVLSARMRKRV